MSTLTGEKKAESIPNGKVEMGARTKDSNTPIKSQTSPGKGRSSPTKTSPEKHQTPPTKNQNSSVKDRSSPTKNRSSPTKNQSSPLQNDIERKSPTKVTSPTGNSEKRTEVNKTKTEPKPKNGATTRDKSQGPKTGRPSGGPMKELSADFKEKFQLFSKFGDTKSDGKLITLSQSDKWMKQAKVVDGKKITTTDTAIHFKKLKSMKVSMKDYNQFIDDLGKTKGIDANEIRDKLAACGAPAVSGAGAENKKVDATVNRLTDVSKYTGSHKQRFDESGKGKGIAGRKDLPEASGYVHGYQNKNTYSKTH